MVVSVFPDLISLLNCFYLFFSILKITLHGQLFERPPPPQFILKLALEVEDLIVDRDFYVKVIKTDLIGDKMKYSIL